MIIVADICDSEESSGGWIGFNSNSVVEKFKEHPNMFVADIADDMEFKMYSYTIHMPTHMPTFFEASWHSNNASSRNVHVSSELSADRIAERLAEFRFEQARSSTRNTRRSIIQRIGRALRGRRNE